MSNHIHLAILAGREPLSSWARRVNSPFAAWINERNQRIGPVFAQTPKDFAISPAREAKLFAYIHKNPVRAGLVKRASQSTWTSHRSFVGTVSPPPWLHVDQALERIGMSPQEFGTWIGGEDGDSGKIATDELDAKLRRRGALRAGTPSRPSIPVVMRPTGYWRPDPRMIVTIACDLSDTSRTLVCSRRHVEEAIIARRSIVYASIAYGLSYAEVGDSLGISHQAVSKIAHRKPTPNELRIGELIRERLEIEEGCGSWVGPDRDQSFRGVAER